MFRRKMALPVAMGVAALALAGCGAKEAGVVQRAFEQEVRSADVRFTVTAREDRTGGKELVRFSMAGPMRSNGPAKLESFDWRLQVRVPGTPAMAARVVSDGDHVSLEYDGQTYVVPDAEVAKYNREKARGAKSNEELDDLEDVQRRGVDLRSWFPESDSEPDTRLHGEAVAHVSGRLDVSRVLRDLQKLARHPALRAQLAGSGLDELGPREIAGIDRAVSDPRFDLYAGKRDGKLRRVDARMRTRGSGDVPALAVSIRFEQRNVDGAQRIPAPARDGRSLEDLMRELGLAGQEQEALGAAGAPA
jgi:hypothetical protein